MREVPRPAARIAAAADALRIGQLLHAFNTEFDDPTPEPRVLAERISALIAGGDTAVLLVGAAAQGLAVLRFRQAIWDDALECYLAELYVVPERRGEGLGRTLLEAAIAHARERGAKRIELGTAESDTAARALYESLGFSNREGGADGAVNYCYEREV